MFYPERIGQTIAKEFKLFRSDLSTALDSRRFRKFTDFPYTFNGICAVNLRDDRTAQWTGHRGTYGNNFGYFGFPPRCIKIEIPKFRQRNVSIVFQAIYNAIPNKLKINSTVQSQSNYFCPRFEHVLLVIRYIWTFSFFVNNYFTDVKNR